MEETSKKVRHTPGPWIIKNEGHYFRNNAVYGRDGKQLTASIYGANKDECEANAQLIASAPSLLEALEALLPYLKAVGTNGNHWIPVVENAIKLAKGNGES